MKKLSKAKPPVLATWTDQVEHYYARILSHPDDMQAYLQLAALLEEHHRYLEALDIYSRGLRQNPRHGLLQMNYGLLLFKLGEVHTAKTLMHVAKEILTSPDPEEIKTFKSLMALLRTQLQSQQLLAACKTLESLLKLDPEHVQNLYQLATIQAHLHNYQQARQSFEKLQQLLSFRSNPKLLSKTLRHLAQLKAKEQPSAAWLEAYQAQRSENPQITPFFFALHQLLLQSGDADTVAFRFQAYLASNPGDRFSALLQTQLGLFYLQAGAREEACLAFEQALKDDPHCIWALYQLGFLQVTRGNLSNARDCFEKVFLLHEEAASLAFEPHSGCESALKALEAQLSSEERQSQSWQEILGLLSFRSAQWKQAITIFQRLLAQDPENTRYLSFLAAALQAEGHIDAAREIYAQFLSLLTFEQHPERVNVVYRNLALLYATETMDLEQQRQYDWAKELNPELTPVFYHWLQLMEQEQTPASLQQRYQRYLETHPQDPWDYLVKTYLAITLRQQRLQDEALELLREVIENHPQCFFALCQMTILALEMEEYENVSFWMRKAGQFKPEARLTLFKLLSSIYILENEPDLQSPYYNFWQANQERLYELALETEPLREKGEFKKIVVIYNAFLKKFPFQIEAIAGKAAALVSDLRNEEAYQLLKPVVESGYLHGQIADAYAQACLYTKRFELSRAYLDRVLARPELHFSIRRRILFALGQMHDKAKEPAKAFPFFVQANQLKSQSWSAQKQEDRTTILMNLFNRETISRFPRGNYTARPVFVLGMPRSGTTLTEQILCSHPDIFGAGEIGRLFHAFTLLIGPQRARFWWNNVLEKPHFVEEYSEKLLKHLSQLKPAQWQEVAQDYLNHMESLADRKGYALIVNKMPANFQYLGLIQVLFPQAIVIHCRRHPLDVCLSCFSIDFKALKWSTNMETLGRYYQQYQRVMAHWKAHLDLPIFEVNYEETIADQEAMSRRLIDICGLEWDERCLSFFKTKRHVKTASFEQVRKPIYKTSVARYKPYEAYLEPLKQWIDLSEWEEPSHSQDVESKNSSVGTSVEAKTLKPAS